MRTFTVNIYFRYEISVSQMSMDVLALVIVTIFSFFPHSRLIIVFITRANTMGTGTTYSSMAPEFTPYFSRVRTAEF